MCLEHPEKEVTQEKGSHGHGLNGAPLITPRESSPYSVFIQPEGFLAALVRVTSRQSLRIVSLRLMLIRPDPGQSH